MTAFHIATTWPFLGYCDANWRFLRSAEVRLSGMQNFHFPPEIPTHPASSQEPTVPHGGSGIDEDDEAVRTTDRSGAAPGSDGPD